MAFPGTCCSSLHRIKGRKLWKQSCEPLGQMPVQEVHRDWVTSKKGRDMATESPKNRILHISILYEIWINRAAPPVEDLLNNSGRIQTHLAGRDEVGQDALDQGPAQMVSSRSCKGKSGFNGSCRDWAATLIEIWSYNSIFASVQTHLLSPMLPENYLWHFFTPSRWHTGPNFTEEFGFVGCSAKGEKCHNKVTACQENKPPLASSQESKMHCLSEQ